MTSEADGAAKHAFDVERSDMASNPGGYQLLADQQEVYGSGKHSQADDRVEAAATQGGRAG